VIGWLRRWLPWLFAVVVLSWDPSPTPSVTGYKVYYGATCQLPLAGPESPQDVGKVLTHSLTLPPGHWCIAVTAYDAAGYESSFSNMVEMDQAGTPTKVKGFRLR